eukprot:6577209-Pyramimonas_sp.AAC.1
MAAAARALLQALAPACGRQAVPAVVRPAACDRLWPPGDARSAPPLRSCERLPGSASERARAIECTRALPPVGA